MCVCVCVCVCLCVCVCVHACVHACVCLCVWCGDGVGSCEEGVNSCGGRGELLKSFLNWAQSSLFFRLFILFLIFLKARKPF